MNTRKQLQSLFDRNHKAHELYQRSEINRNLSSEEKERNAVAVKTQLIAIFEEELHEKIKHTS